MFRETSIIDMLPRFPEASRLPNEQVLGDFAQVLSHRIRNLLTGIEGFTDLLADTLGSPEQRELVLRILESTTRIEFVLNDLLYYSQPVRMAKMPIAVRDVVERLLETLDEADRDHVTLVVAPVPGCLMADSALLRQVLLTLVQNAFEATATHKQVRIEIAYDDATGTVRFNVWNKGVIDLEEASHKVFEPFFTTKPHNLGIGLPVARRIVDAHDGTLYLAVNNQAQGTCFTLELPLATEAEPTSLYGE